MSAGECWCGGTNDVQPVKLMIEEHRQKVQVGVTFWCRDCRFRAGVFAPNVSVYDRTMHLTHEPPGQ